MAKPRTITELHRELLEEDPHCALTKSALRRLVVTGAIPSVRVGVKYLINRESVDRYLEGKV